MRGFINVIKLSGKLHVCPDVHESKEVASKALEKVLGKYWTPHLKFVIEPIEIELPDGE